MVIKLLSDHLGHKKTSIVNGGLVHLLVLRQVRKVQPEINFIPGFSVIGFSVAIFCGKGYWYQGFSNTVIANSKGYLVLVTFLFIYSGSYRTVVLYRYWFLLFDCLEKSSDDLFCILIIKKK